MLFWTYNVYPMLKNVKNETKIIPIELYIAEDCLYILSAKEVFFGADDA